MEEIKKEEKAPRSKEEIQKEYTELCQRVGEIGFRQAVMKEDAQAHYKRMWELNKESQALASLPKEEAAALQAV